jgi:hypothetical protein
MFTFPVPDHTDDGPHSHFCAPANPITCSPINLFEYFLCGE